MVAVSELKGNPVNPDYDVNELELVNEENKEIQRIKTMKEKK